MRHPAIPVLAECLGDECSEGLLDGLSGAHSGPGSDELELVGDDHEVTVGIFGREFDDEFVTVGGHRHVLDIESGACHGYNCVTQTSTRYLLTQLCST